MVYGIGTILGQSISFLMLPIYTRVFGPGGYGVIEMLTVIAGLLGTLIVMGTDSAQSFHFFKEKKEGIAAQRAIISSVLLWRLVWGLGLVLLFYSLGPVLNRMFFEGKLSQTYFAVAFAGGMVTILIQQSIDVTRLLMRPWQFVGINTLLSVTTASAVMFFAVYKGLGVLGYVIGVCTGASVGCLFSWWSIREYLCLDKTLVKLWPKLLRFGAPLLPSTLALYLMSSSDRWFIQHYAGDVEVGIYSIGAKFGLIMSLAVQIFRRAWWPIALDSMHAGDGPETFRMISRLFVGIGSAAAVYVGFLAPFLINWFTGPGFDGSATIVGILAWQALFYGLYSVGSAGIWKSEKTYLNSVLMSISAVINLGLNYLLVPEYGGIGAAIGTVIAYFSWAISSIIVSEKLWWVGFPKVLLGGQIAVAVAVSVWNTNYDGSLWVKTIVVHVVVAGVICSAFTKEMVRSIWKHDGRES